MRRILLFVITCSFFFSCAQKDPLALKTREVDYLNKTIDVIQAEKLDIDVLGIQDIVVYDSLLLFVTTEPSGMLQVYNKNSLEYMASFCSQGRAKNEFTGQVLLVNRQYYVDNGELIIPLLDNESLIQKEINVSASLREGHTVVDGTEIRSTDAFNSVLLDNELETTFSYRAPYENPETGEITMPVFSVKRHNEITRKINVFRRHVRCEDPKYLQSCYRGNMLKHPDRNIVAYTMGIMDYILFFDFDNNNYYALHQIGSPSASELYVYKDRKKNHSCFGGPLADPTSDRFMVFYFGGNFTANSREKGEMGCEVLLFNWEGEYLGGGKLDTNFLCASYDPETKMLFAANIVSEEIFTFDLSGLMNIIANE